MKKAFLLAASLLMTASISNAQIAARVPASAQKLIDAYPDMHLSYSDNAIVFPDGTRIVYDDGKEKDFVTKLDNSDVEDMFSMTYDTTVSEPAGMNIDASMSAHRPVGQRKVRLRPRSHSPYR